MSVYAKVVLEEMLMVDLMKCEHRETPSVDLHERAEPKCSTPPQLYGHRTECRVRCDT